MRANTLSLCLATARAELSRFHLILSCLNVSDGANLFQCKENLQWHILTSVWMIISYLLRYVSRFSYSCWIIKLKRRWRRLFPCTQEFAASRACIRPVARPANQHASERAALAPKTASREYNGMRTRRTATKTNRYCWIFMIFLKIYIYSLFRKKYFSMWLCIIRAGWEWYRSYVDEIITFTLLIPDISNNVFFLSQKTVCCFVV